MKPAYGVTGAAVTCPVRLARVMVAPLQADVKRRECKQMELESSSKKKRTSSKIMEPQPSTSKESPQFIQSTAAEESHKPRTGLLYAVGGRLLEV